MTSNTALVKWRNPPDIPLISNEINCIPKGEHANAVYTSVGPNTTEITIHDLESGTEYTMMIYTRLGEAVSRKRFRDVFTTTRWSRLQSSGLNVSDWLLFQAAFFFQLKKHKTLSNVKMM